MSGPVTDNPWQALRALTAARIALGRAGVSLPTAAQLDLQLAHARARDAVHTPLDMDALVQALALAQTVPGRAPLLVHSACADRPTYLQRPDLGRVLDAASSQALAALRAPPCQLALVLADGLSAQAVAQHGAPFIEALMVRLAPDGWGEPAIVIAQQARVAIGDQIGALLKASCVVVLIGERPGLSSPDSMGLYLTWQPHAGLSDAQRNCISNVRPAGMSYAQAAYKLHYLLGEARRRALSGVALKDETEQAPARVRANFLLP
jgi:ethanolamine ammonia-lyase small subunit